LVKQDYWDASYESAVFSIAPKDSIIRRWIEAHVGDGKGSCIEVGAFPGTYLSVFGELGYELNGIDLSPGVEEDLPNWLKEKGYKVGRFYRDDFLGFKSNVRYQIVCSFGFVEHFSDWENILVMHSELVDKGGLLVVSAPNFRGIIQRSIHLLLNRENYRRHNIKSMRPERWRKILESKGFRTRFCGHFGGFHFWVDSVERNFFQKAALKTLVALTPFLKRIITRNSSAYSPHCGIVMIRESEPGRRPTALAG